MVQDYSQVKSGSKTTVVILVVFCGLAAGLVTAAYFFSARQLLGLREMIANSRTTLATLPVEKVEPTPDVAALEITKKRTAYTQADLAVGEYWEKKNYKEASASSLLLFENAVTPADWVNAYGWSGHILVEQKKLKEAEVAFKKALELNPKYMNGYSGLDEVYYARKDYKNMLANAEKALEVRPDSSTFYNEKGVALDGLSRTQEAVAAYRKAIELDPENRVAVDNLRISLQDL